MNDLIVFAGVGLLLIGVPVVIARLPIPTKPPVCNGIMPPRDSWMMPPTVTE